MQELKVLASLAALRSVSPPFSLTYLWQLLEALEEPLEVLRLAVASIHHHHHYPLTKSFSFLLAILKAFCQSLVLAFLF